MIQLPVTDDFWPPFAALPFGDGWAVIDTNGNFPASAIIALGETIPGYEPGDAEWPAAADEAWCQQVADALTAEASGT